MSVIVHVQYPCVNGSKGVVSGGRMQHSVRREQKVPSRVRRTLYNILSGRYIRKINVIVLER